LPAKMAGEFATLFARLANSPDAVTNNVKGIYGAKTASSPLRHGIRGPSAWSRREHPPYNAPARKSLAPGMVQDRPKGSNAIDSAPLRRFCVTSIGPNLNHAIFLPFVKSQQLVFPRSNSFCHDVGRRGFAGPPQEITRLPARGATAEQTFREPVPPYARQGTPPSCRTGLAPAARNHHLVH